MPVPNMIKPTPAVGNRKHMPPINSIVTADEKLSSYRSDDTMMEAFGLTDDKQHWLRMKAHGLYVCQQELPPTSLPKNARKKHESDEEAIRKLQYNSATDVAKSFLWEFALTSWREAFDYDIQYLQKRYPDCYAKGVICGMFAKWNSGPDFKWLSRKHAKGRDLYQLYYHLSSERDAHEELTIREPAGPQEPQGTHNAIEDHTKDAATAHSVMLEHQIARPKDTGETTMNNGDVYWAHVILDIQHLDQMKAKLNRLAFTFICGPHPCVPSNIQMDIIKEKLRVQGVNADHFDFQLKGFADRLSWELSDMCVALTLWCRTRSELDFDVPLLLVPRESQLSNTQNIQEETLRNGADDLTTNMNTTSNIGSTQGEEPQTSTRMRVNEPVKKTLFRGRKRMRPILNLTNEASSDEDEPPRSARRVQQEISQVRRELLQLRWSPTRTPAYL